MKKVLSAIMVMAIMLTSAVSVFANEEYTFKTITNSTYLRSDGALYSVWQSDNKPEATLVGTDVIMATEGSELNRYYFNKNYKEYFESMDTYVYEENGYVDHQAGMNILKPKDEATKTIPDLTDKIGIDLFLSKDGKIYYFADFIDGSHYLNCIADIGGMKEYREESGYSYILSESNTLYCTSANSIVQIATDVKDFKTSHATVFYRTYNNDLYYSVGYGESQFLLSNCSQWYSGSNPEDKVFAKDNNGKWYHMGYNDSFCLEPERKVDGNNITPNRFDQMVEATEYVYRPNGYYGAYEWNKDGNLYCYTDDTKELIAENIIYMEGQSLAVTADGDMIILSYNRKGDFVDTNIKNPERYAWFFSYSPYLNTDNNISMVSIKHSGRNKTAYLNTIKLSEKYPDRSDWAQAEIEQADAIGYIDSVKLIPMQNNIKREDFCNMIVDFCEKYLGRELSTTANPFEDTENEKVIKAYANGIITGISYDEFAPDNNITREQMCAIMTRAAKFLKPDVQFGEGIKFSDMNSVSDWAVEGVNAMSGLGIVKGDGVSITPKSNTSVEQAIAMTYRLYNKIR